MAAQSPIVRFLDFVDEIVSGKEKRRGNIFILLAYGVFSCLAMVVWRHFSDKDFSYVCTLAGFFQTLGFFLLLHKMKTQRSAAGVSSKTLQMYVLTCLFRLSSTLCKNGYLPVDRSGDWVYQATDIATLMIVFQILFFIHKRYKDTYQAELDTMPVWKLVPACMLLGSMCHGNLNHSPFFDKTWTIGMWLDTVAMLPQLWMLVAKGGQVEALTSNFVALIFLSRCLSLSFWYTGYGELAPKDGGFNVIGTMIMTAQSLQVLLSADFMYHYFAWQSSNCSSSLGCGSKPTTGVVLPPSFEFVPSFEFDI